LINILGPSPGAKGGDNSFNSTTNTNGFTSSCTQLTPCGFGIFDRVDATIIQPLYTFGKITSGKEAAAGGVKVDEARVNQKASDIIMKVNEYYYGFLLARDLKVLVLDVKEKLDSAKEKVEQQLAEESKYVDELDLLKLKTFGGVVERYFNEADKSVELAQNALGMTIGLEKTGDFEVADQHLKQETRPLFDLDTYIEKAKLYRPEFTQLREGLRARQALIRVAKSDYYPTFFAAFYLSYAVSSNRDYLNNPYVYDPFQHIFTGTFLGLKWNYNFGITSARVQSAQAEHDKLLETQAFADAGIPLQVRKAYLELVEANKISRRRTNLILPPESGSFRPWRTSTRRREAKEIFEALRAYAENRSENYKAVYNYNLALQPGPHDRRGHTKIQMRRNMVRVFILWAISALFFSGVLHAVPVQAGAPTDQLKTSTDAVLRLLNDEELKRPEKFKERRAVLRKTIVGRFDFAEMAKRALATQWAKRTPEEKKEFVDMFTNLLEKSYMDRIEAYTDEVIEYTARASTTTMQWSHYGEPRTRKEFH
jgi:outer membrane protein TolC